jgi:LysR family transcriptional regulator for metE and metH
MQLVASGRGVAALPNWGVKSYVDHDYVAARRIGKSGLWSELYAMAPRAVADRLYFSEFVRIVREVCQRQLEGITLLSEAGAG